MANDFDITRAAASVYAESLLELAEEAGQADSVGEELADLRRLWDADAAFARLMASAAIDDDARAMSIRKVFGEGHVSALVFKFLMVLNHKRRSMILPAVCDAYKHLLDANRGRGEVFVSSAVPLEDAHRASLKAQVQRLTGLELTLVEQVDPNLLGGLRIQVSDRVYDASVRRRLGNLRSELLSAVEKHLLGGTSRFVTEG
ncbi:MAG: ATP synthase F1 subunit delta [Phycisphaerae bacterium]